MKPNGSTGYATRRSILGSDFDSRPGNGQKDRLRKQLTLNLKLYVANLAPATTYNELMNLSSAHGKVTEIDLLDDRPKGRPSGFGFVTMATSEGAQAAIEDLHRKEIGTHVLTVSKMQPDELRSGPASGGRSPRRAYSCLY